jgi:two-component system chemotaxis response regulator CheY
MKQALVVDDSRAIRMILSRTLKDLGYDVAEAANGMEALQTIGAEPNGLELVLADWNMPELNGLELVKRLRRNPAMRDLVILMVTTETEIEHMTAALEAGANEYIMKPFTQDILRDKLRMTGLAV